jgi:serine phosphatase RsbU (regulator of sigma subunit)
MTQLRSATRAYAIGGDPPAAILAHLNAYCLTLRLTDMVTIAVALLDPATGELTYASAGHPPPLLIDAAGAVTLTWTPVGPPLGVTAPPPPETELSLLAGAALVLYTDGLVEERTRPLDETLAELCTMVAGPFGSAAELCARVRDARMAGAAGDDVALLVCRRAP